MSPVSPPAPSSSSAQFSPNWLDDVRHYFNQLDVIKMRAAGRYAIDLRDYENVKLKWRRVWLAVQPSTDPRRAALGWSRIAYVRRMPLVGPRWPQSRVDAFRDWVRLGHPYSRDSKTPPPAPPAPTSLAEFVALSQALTGFDSLAAPSARATGLFERFKAHPRTSPYWASLLVEWARVASSAAAAGEPPTIASLLEHGVLGPVCRELILLWYSGAFYNEPGGFLERFPADFGTGENNHYLGGLMWRAIDAHPQGYSVEDNLYWRFAPQPDGRFTGSKPEDFRPRVEPPSGAAPQEGVS